MYSKNLSTHGLEKYSWDLWGLEKVYLSRFIYREV